MANGSFDERRGDVVGQVAGDDVRLVRREVDVQGVGIDHLQVGGSGEARAE